MAELALIGAAHAVGYVVANPDKVMNCGKMAVNGMVALYNKLRPTNCKGEDCNLHDKETLDFGNYHEEMTMKQSRGISVDKLECYILKLCEMNLIPKEYGMEFLLEVYAMDGVGMAMSEHEVFDIDKRKGFMKCGAFGAIFRGDGTVDVLMYIFEIKFETKKKWFSGSITASAKDTLQEYCQQRKSVRYEEKQAAIEEV